MRYERYKEDSVIVVYEINLMVENTSDALKFTNATIVLKDLNIFIGDTGATSNTTSNTTNSFYGFTNIEKATKRDNILDASGNNINSRMIRDLKGKIYSKQGHKQADVIIKDIVYMPESGYNLFNLIKRLDQGWTLGGDSEQIWLEKGEQKIPFNIKVKTPKGAIYAMYIKRKPANNNEITTMGTDKKNPIKVTEAHGLMGHMNKVDSRRFIKHLGFHLSHRSMPLCAAYAVAKVK